MVNIKGIIGNEEGEVNLLSVIEQIESQSEKGIALHVVIDSIGGDLDEGISIYNYLKSLKNKVITESINNCASAASIIFMAGDRRIAGCPIMIHNPFVEGVSGTGDQLKELSKFVKGKESQMENIYAQYTTVDSKILSNLMDKETYISPSQAVSINLATEAKQIAIARLNTNINENEVKMSKKEKGFKELLLGALGIKAKVAIVYNMELTTADNATLQVDREEGVPQIGDSASPDGSHTMPDGSVIVVENGVITEIVSPSAEGESEGAEEVAEAIEDIIADLQNEVDTLKEDLAIAKAQARTKEDLVILNAVKMGGGYERLFKDKASSYKPQARTTKETKVQVSNSLRDKIEEIKEQAKKKGVN